MFIVFSGSIAYFCFAVLHQMRICQDGIRYKTSLFSGRSLDPHSMGLTDRDAKAANHNLQRWPIMHTSVGLWLLIKNCPYLHGRCQADCKQVSAHIALPPQVDCEPGYDRPRCNLTGSRSIAFVSGAIVVITAFISICSLSERARVVG